VKREKNMHGHEGRRVKGKRERGREEERKEKGEKDSGREGEQAQECPQQLTNQTHYLTCSLAIIVLQVS